MALYKEEYLLSGNLYPLLGKSIRRLRRRREITQEELAEAVNIDQKQISYIESGKARARLPTYLRIANVFGVSIDHFLADALLIEPEHLPMILIDGEEEQCFLLDVIHAVLRYLDEEET